MQTLFSRFHIISLASYIKYYYIEVEAGIENITATITTYHQSRRNS